MLDFADQIARAGAAGAVCLFLALIGGFVLLFVFLPEKKERQYKDFTLQLYRILNFRKMFSMTIIKLMYLISMLFITLMGLVVLFSENFFGGLLTIIIGNLIIRVVYELCLLVFSIHENLSQINHTTSQILTNMQNDSTQNIPETNIENNTQE